MLTVKAWQNLLSRSRSVWSWPQWNVRSHVVDAVATAIHGSAICTLHTALWRFLFWDAFERDYLKFLSVCGVASKQAEPWPALGGSSHSQRTPLFPEVQLSVMEFSHVGTWKSGIVVLRATTPKCPFSLAFSVMWYDQGHVRQNKHHQVLLHSISNCCCKLWSIFLLYTRTLWNAVCWIKCLTTYSFP